MDVDHFQAIVQVLTKSAFLDLHFQILIGRRQDTHVDRNHFPPAQPLDHALLQHAQDFGLRRETQVSYLI